MFYESNLFQQAVPAQYYFESTVVIISVYDASGHYPQQFLFGNDYWLGSKSLCEELANKITNKEVPPFDVYFYVAQVKIKISKDITPMVSMYHFLNISCH